MSECVVDTNVLVVANRRDTATPAACVRACVALLRDIQAHGRLVLDTEFRILNEYRHNANEAGKPGSGDAFLLWALRNQRNPNRCVLQAITCQPDGGGENYAEFPTDPALHSFDRSDRKFVAVSCAHPARPPIYNAVDSDWWHHAVALHSNGVVVIELCS